MRSFNRSILLGITILFVLTACGGGSGDGSGGGSTSTINGTAATGIAIDGIVYVTDRAGTQINVPIDSAGNYAADIAGMIPPFIISAVPSDTNLPTQYSYATSAGTTNITSLTTLTLFNATSQSDLSVLETNWSRQSGSVTVTNLEMAQAQINANFSTAFLAQGINPVTYDFFSAPLTVGSGVDLVLDALVIVVDFSSGTASITLNGVAFVFDFNIDIIGIDIGGDTGSFGTLSITGADASIFGGSHTPDSVKADGPPNSVTWTYIAGNVGSGLVVDRISGTPLEPGRIAFSYTKISPFENYAYGLSCVVSADECAKISIDQAARTVSFDKVIIDDAFGTDNSATAPIEISGLFTW